MDGNVTKSSRLLRPRRTIANHDFPSFVFVRTFRSFSTVLSPPSRLRATLRSARPSLRPPRAALRALLSCRARTSLGGALSRPAKLPDVAGRSHQRNRRRPIDPRDVTPPRKRRANLVPYRLAATRSLPSSSRYPASLLFPSPFFYR